MATILEFVRRAGSVLASLPVFRNSSFETALTYNRKDNKHVDFVVVHLPNISGEGQRTPFLALSCHSIKHNPNGAPSVFLKLSMEEGRLLRDFINRPEVAEWLDEEEEA